MDEADCREPAQRLDGRMKPRLRNHALLLTIAKGVVALVAALLLLVLADAAVATRRAELVRASVRPEMTSAEVVQAVASRASLLMAQDCPGEAPADCRAIRIAVRGPFLASYILVVTMGPDGRVNRVTQTGPLIWGR